MRIVTTSGLLRFRLPCLVALAFLATPPAFSSPTLCRSILLNRSQDPLEQQRIKLSFPAIEKEPFQIATISKEPLTSEEQQWILSIVEPALKKAKSLKLTEDAVHEIMFFRSEKDSAATGLSTDNRRTLVLSDWVLSQRDATVLLHELGHILADKTSNSYLNSILGMGEAMADLSIYFLSGATAIGADARASIPMRSMVDRKDVIFDRSRSADTISKELSTEQARELNTVRSDYLGGELFTRILLDILKVPAFKKEFEFNVFVKKIGEFISFSGSSLRNSQASQYLVEEIIKAHNQSSYVDYGIMSSLADCYWGLAVLVETYPSHGTAFQTILQKRNINLNILNQFIDSIQSSQKDFSRRDFLPELKQLNLRHYSDFKESEIQTEQQAREVIQSISDYLMGIGKFVEFDLKWNSDEVKIVTSPTQKKVKIAGAFVQLRNMTRDSFAWSLLQGASRIHGEGYRDEYGGLLEPQADYWASVHFNRYLKKNAQSVLNKMNVPERTIRAIYFMMDYWRYAGTSQRDFHPYAQHPGPLSKETVADLQQKWDYAIEGAME